MEFVNEHILSLLIFFPIVGIFFLALLPKEKVGLIKIATLFITVLEFIFSLHIYYHFQVTDLPTLFSEKVSWIGLWNVNYHIGIDGVSMLLVVLSAFMMPIAILGTWNSIKKDHKVYYISLLALLTGMVGVFCALDLFLFYLFWEVMLVPMYFLIGIWGGENRRYAAIKFFLYTMAGSILMLIAILYLYFKAGNSFSLFRLYETRLGFHEQLWLFAAFALAFAIKVPLFPFHTWLPDAHVQAPTAGSVILAGVLLKMGVYGFIRFAIPLFPDVVYFEPLRPYLFALATIGIVYGALVAMVQKDIKKLIAYSSVSHMGVVMLGVFSLNQTALMGGMFQMISHAISTGGLFLLIGMLYDRTHTRMIKDYSGLAKIMPIYTIVFMIVTMSSIAVPLTNGFVGEFLTLVGSYQVTKLFTILSATGVIFGAIYMLWMVQRVFFGEVKKTHGTETDLNFRELLTMLPLLVLIFVMGIYPKPILKKVENVAVQVLERIPQQEALVQNKIK